MNPIQNNGKEAQTVPLYERIDKVDVTKTDTLSKELAGLTEEANAEVSNVFSKDSENGAKVTGGESCRLNIIKSSFCRLNTKIKASLQSASDEVKQIYQQLTQKVSETIDRLTKAINGVNPDVAVFEPEETDAEQNKYNTPYYKELTKKANTRLSELQKEKDSIAAEQNWYRKHSPFGYYGKTPEDAGEFAMKEIAQMFLGYDAVEDDANYLIQWANKMWNGKKISSEEKRILTDHANEKLASLHLQKARELAEKEQSNDNANVSNSKNNNNQAAMPKYDRKNDGHNTAWEAAGIKKES